MKHIYLISIIFFSFCSCKKDKLVDDKILLAGNWIYTQHTYGWCNNNPAYETLFPNGTSNTGQVEFLESGKINYYENGKLVNKYRLVFNYFELGSDGASYFYSYLNNDSILGLTGRVHDDTLHLSRFPYIEEDPNCENYLNVFVRE